MLIKYFFVYIKEKASTCLFSFNSLFMYRFVFLLGFCLLLSCNDSPTKSAPSVYSSVAIVPIFQDSISIRAIALKEDYLFYAGSMGKYGYIALDSMGNNLQYEIEHAEVHPEFRSNAAIGETDFILSVASPALLYEVGRDGVKTLRYKEADSLAFYDAMAFWNDKEGIAMGDPTDTCMSILITRDGGVSWQKVSCEDLPKAAEGEAAFAASDSNISIFEDQVWMITGGKESNVLHSADKGKTWTVQELPIVEGKSTTGGYSIDFYNAKIGVVIGGDYTQMQENTANKAITFDGGKTWKLIAKGKNPGYRSCIQFVPNSEGKAMVAVGPKGISYSGTSGETWEKLSNEGFYTFRFQNDSVAYAAGKNRVAKLIFR